MSLSERAARLARGLISALRLEKHQPERPDAATPTFVFFSPDAGVSLHFVTICVLARALKDRGHDVLIVRCGEQYRQCVVMDMLGQQVDKTEAERVAACTLCHANHDRMTAAYGLPTVAMGELVDAPLLARLEALVADMPADAGAFEVEGVRFGILCSSDIALTTKSLDQMNAVGAVRSRLEAYVFGALLSFHATKRLLERGRVARLIFFNEYAMLAGAALAAARAGVPVTRVTVANHKDVDRSKIVMLHKPLGAMSSHEALDTWAAWRDLPLSPSKVEEVGDNYISRITGAGITVYSPKHSGDAASLVDRLGLSAERRTLVAYTSSLDELNANRNLMRAFGVDLFQAEQPFVDQIDWLTALIVHVEASDDLQLVVRVHPREGANERDGRRSEHLAKLMKAFSGDYRHVRFVWPEDKISSYDLAEIAAVALPAWSNISLEIAALGVPVIVAFQRYVPFPVPDVVDWAPDRDEYFRLIGDVCRREPSFERMRQLYRWSHRYTLAIATDLGDLMPDHAAYGELPEWRTPRAAPIIEEVLVGGRSIVDINRDLLAADTTASEAAEREALLRQIGRAIHALGGGEPLVADDPACGARERTPSPAVVRLRRLAMDGDPRGARG